MLCILLRNKVREKVVFSIEMPSPQTAGEDALAERRMRTIIGGRAGQYSSMPLTTTAPPSDQ